MACRKFDTSERSVFDYMENVTKYLLEISRKNDISDEDFASN